MNREIFHVHENSERLNNVNMSVLPNLIQFLDGSGTPLQSFAWKIPWMEEPGGLQSLGSQRLGHDRVTSLSLSCIGEGNGNPLQCSCLENPRDRGTWWAAVYGVAQIQTRLKQLSSSSSSNTKHWECLVIKCKYT